MGALLERLAEKKLLVSDGAWGTMLHAKGLTAGDCPEEWNVSHPEAVRAVAEAYAAAGSDLILTNTFGGSSVKLAKAGLGARAVELNRAGARLSVEGAPGAVVAGSVGPTGEFLAPLGTMTEADLEAVFSAQIGALLEGGARALCVETMTAVEEAVCAVRAAKKLAPQVDVIVTMTFDAVQQGGYRTMMGVAPERAAQAAAAAGADVVGANCGNGIERMIEIAAEFRRQTALPILIHANAGMPELADGKTVFKETPEQTASRVKELVAAGANIVGGCCGTTPEHIAAIKAVVDELRGG